jgi:phosphatidylinositol-3-phosphatase
VIWIWMENHSASQIVGAPDAAYVTGLARRCGLATRYDAVAHPSLPNYIAATSGATGGITDDGPPAEHAQSSVSLFEQAPSAGSFEESMPSSCALADAYPYAAKHNPEAYYLRLRKSCPRDDLPLGTPAGGSFARALAGTGLPAFSFVTPNLCDDMHSCPVATGDRWLAKWVPAITSSPSYRAGHTVLFITWDENDGRAGNRVPLIVVARSVKPGTTVSTPFTHYSLLRTTEELLGIRPYLGHAATARSMRAAFGL